MKQNTCLVIDTWEGQLEIDEAALKAGGVAGISIRINDMNGGHHMDTGFSKQWAEAVNFVRFPYFVYNPWVDGAANFAWLKAHMPADAKSVAIDVEVKFANYPPNKYAGELVNFLNLCKPLWKTIIYTAEWFLNDLASWPRTDYWWAQYPAGDSYFKNVKDWSQLQLALDALSKPFNVAQVPGTLKLWQFSGDYLTLPGTSRKIDVNIFYGTEQELAAYFGTSPVSDEPSTPIPDTEVPAVTKSGLYTFADNNYWPRPGGGPLTLPMTHVRGKLGDNLSRYEWSQLAPVIRKLNPTNPSAIDQIAAPDWGPSKGLDGNYIKWIGLLWPGRNIVKVDEIVNGWGHVSSCPMYDASRLDVNNNPDLVHMVYDYNKSAGYGERAKPVYVPILGGPWWVDMGKLVSIDNQLPKRVRALSVPWLNVRSEPSTAAAIVGKRLFATTFDVYEVRIAPGGLWGRVDGGWVALRNAGKNLTDWKI